MMARYPAPMAGWSLVIPMVVDTILKALGAAPCRTTCRPRITALLGGAVVFFGNDPKTGRRFVVQSIEGGGWGGRPTEDGASGTVSVCQGDVRNGSIEGIELKCPVLVKGRALRAGFGRRRAVPRRARHRRAGREFRRGPLEFRAHQARHMPALGHLGGKPAGTADYLLRLPQENEFQLGQRRASAGAGALPR